MKARVTIISIVLVYLVMFSLAMTFFHDVRSLLYLLMSIIALSAFVTITLVGTLIIIFNIYAFVSGSRPSLSRRGPIQDL